MEANRVMEILCLFWAIHGRNMSLVLKSSFCMGLSVDLLDDDQYTLFTQQFRAFKEHFDASVE